MRRIYGLGAALALLLGSVCPGNLLVFAAEGKKMMKIGHEVVSLQSGDLFTKAQEAISSSKFELAEQLLQDFLKANPKSASGRYKYGYALLQEGKNREAAEQARRCVELDPSFVGGWSLLAESSFNLQERKESERAFRQVLVLEPTGENAELARERLEELAGTSKPAQAAPGEDSVAAADGENSKIAGINEALSLCSKANEDLKNKQFELGLQECRAALAKVPDSDRIRENYAVYLNNYAAACVNEGNLEKAESLMKEAIGFQAKGAVSLECRRTTVKNYRALLNYLNRPDEARALRDPE